VIEYSPALNADNFKTVEILGHFAILRNTRRAVCPMSIEMAHVFMYQWNSGIAGPNLALCIDIDIDIGMCVGRGVFAVDIIPTQAAI
jgi:hypothetical protein